MWDITYEVEFSSLCKRNCGNAKTVLNKTRYSIKSLSLQKPEVLTGKMSSSQHRGDPITEEVGGRNTGFSSQFVGLERLSGSADELQVNFRA